ncbi:MAG TPA: hypothetical protein VHY32_03415, partial [Caulobacteraceae bacterium]|nr:hypothetical protein [Caulobacteraceae bacterium]
MVLSLFSVTASASANEPQSAKARFEAALDNMLTLERPDQIGLATIWDGNKYVQCRRDPDNLEPVSLPPDLAKSVRRKDHASGAGKPRAADAPAPTDPSKHAVLCEAAGARMQPSLAHLLVSDRIEALGWVTDPGFGNFVQVFPAGASIGGTTDRILQTLGEGYGADLGHL